MGCDCYNRKLTARTAQGAHVGKKKKTAAQAAAARYEKTDEDVARAKAKERSKLIRQSAEAAQKKARQGVGFRMLMPFILVAVIVVFALIFTIGPGMLLGK